MRIAVVATATCLSIMGLAHAQDAKAAIRMPTNIPAQGLGPALKSFAQERNLQVLYFAQTVRNMRTAGASGELTADEALTQLLSGTGLVYRYVDDKAVTILPAGTQAGPLPAKGNDPNGPHAHQEGEKSFSPGFRLAQVAGGTNSPSAAVESSTSAQGSQGVQLEEIVVTAQKREERLRDVPVPVTAITGDSLAQSNEVRIQDYALSVPGFSVSGQNGFYQTLSIRGITTGTANPTVGIMIDDVPFGSASIDGGGLFVPDIDPGDLARVEVLRGPQGTLYGASSMGGLLKFVTIDPSTTEFTGRLSAGTSTVDNGAKLGYSARGSVNVPIADTWAIRFSGFTREDPGYIDDPLLHRDGVNKTGAYGGRIAALWRPSEALTIKLSALYQDVKIGGDNYVAVAPGLRPFDQIEVPGAGSSDMKVQVYSATVTAKLGIADLTAISGYNINSSQYSQDYSALFDSTQQFSVAGTRLGLAMRNERITQEIRLAMPLGTVADWLLGAFVSHEHTSYLQNLYAEDATTGAIAGQWVTFSVPQKYTEYSGFTDITFHVSDRLDVQFGARDSKIKQTSSETQSGAPYAALIGSPDPNVYPAVNSSVNALTYLFTPRFKLSSDWMLYARLASGYRPGGPNVAPGVPQEYQPDKTNNYEVGLKGDLLDHKVYFEGSLYYIDWKNIQLVLLDPQTYQGYTANASHAKSQGIELSANVTPFAGLTATAWLAWNTSVLKQGFPYSGIPFEAYGAAGDRLPFGSRFSGNVSVNEEFRLSARVKASLGITESYVGNQIGGFQNGISPGVAPPRQSYPSYARTDLRAGVHYDNWSVNLFANNVTNRYAIVPLGGLDASPLPANYFTVLQPRLIGLNVTRNF